MYGRDDVFFCFCLSYLTAISVWNTDEEIEREPTTGHDRTDMRFEQDIIGILIRNQAAS